MHGKIAASMSLALGLILAALPPGTARAAERLGSYAIDPGAISISGISSGGFMANQFHVAHSATIMGAGIVAGGPYACARVNAGFGDYLGSYKELWNAVYVCSHQAGAIPVFGAHPAVPRPPGPRSIRGGHPRHRGKRRHRRGGQHARRSRLAVLRHQGHPGAPVGDGCAPRLLHPDPRRVHGDAGKEHPVREPRRRAPRHDRRESPATTTAWTSNCPTSTTATTTRPERC